MVSAARGESTMIIGVPREIKDHEARVGVTPAGARALTDAGHTVLVETHAGELSSFHDHEYQDAGAEIVGDAGHVWGKAEMVVKVKEPVAAEYPYFREGLVLFTYLHLAPLPELTDRLLAARVTGIAYETVRDKAGTLPLLTPMSEVAGRMSIQVGATYLEKERGGRGILLGGVPGVPPANVCIIGEADLVVGGVLIPGATAPKIVTKAMVSRMKKGAVIVDVAIDQGGCVETARPTSHSDPSFVVDGVVHYCVTNMPGAVPHTSTLALTNATFPYLMRLANQGAEAALRSDYGLAEGLNVYRGKLTHRGVAESQGRDWVAASGAIG
jgi:alanine dehydrogenase